MFSRSARERTQETEVSNGDEQFSGNDVFGQLLSGRTAAGRRRLRQASDDTVRKKRDDDGGDARRPPHRPTTGRALLRGGERSQGGQETPDTGSKAPSVVDVVIVLFRLFGNLLVLSVFSFLFFVCIPEHGIAANVAPQQGRCDREGADALPFPSVLRLSAWFSRRRVFAVVGDRCSGCGCCCSGGGTSESVHIQGIGAGTGSQDAVRDHQLGPADSIVCCTQRSGPGILKSHAAASGNRFPIEID